ncbi:MAG: SPOR domain-containing protein [Desulfuromonadales bacterium]|nr:SPOR domain-containing protein [Desulfuromonadales bacterium]
MVQVNRRERRVANRKPIFTAVLIAVVALFSFGIGYMAGRNNSAPIPTEVVSPMQPQSIEAVKPDLSIAVVEEKVEEEKLTFFEALPKGEQQPLGSGINLPPEETDPVAAKIAQQPAAVAPSAVKPPADSSTPTVTTPKTTVATANVSHVLQIASFRSPDEAGILVRRLEKNGYQPYIQQADLGSKGIWYRVFLGPYSSQEQAQTAAISLKAKEKLDSLVRRK